MIIQHQLLGCWRESHEDKATDEEHLVCPERRPRIPPSRQGGPENRQDVRDTDLCVGKRQSGGQETVSFLNL